MICSIFLKRILRFVSTCLILYTGSGNLFGQPIETQSKGGSVPNIIAMLTKALDNHIALPVSSYMLCILSLLLWLTSILTVSGRTYIVPMCLHPNHALFGQKYLRIPRYDEAPVFHVFILSGIIRASGKSDL